MLDFFFAISLIYTKCEIVHQSSVIKIHTLLAQTRSN